MRHTVVMAQRHWSQARLDFDVAKSLLQPNRYYAAADYAHEAAEKALKGACWHVRAEEPPYTHDLGLLIELLMERLKGVPDSVITATDRLDALFNVIRYPSGRSNEPIPGELVSEEHARSAVGSAEGVMTWVQELLQQPPGRPRRGKKG